jgi:hypothetical protein
MTVQTGLSVSPRAGQHGRKLTPGDTTGKPAANAARTTLHLDCNQHHDLQPVSTNHPARATTNTAIAAPEPPARRQVGARAAKECALSLARQSQVRPTKSSAMLHNYASLPRAEAHASAA